jgi:rfaE bifunctional protein kinase chain/domain
MAHGLLDSFGDLTVVVYGDFAVDRYLRVDPSIEDRSVETGLPIRQVVSSRATPGGAGTVTSNLAAIGVGRVVAVGAIGDDGEGLGLRRAMEERGVDCSRLMTLPERPTPVYMKVLEPEGESWRERDRLDVFPRRPLEGSVEQHLQEELAAACEGASALLISDYGEAGKAGVVGSATHKNAAALSTALSNLVVLADSRLRLGLFEGVAIKPNEAELRRLLEMPASGDIPVEDLLEAGQDLARRRGATVFATLAERGALVCSAETARHLPAWPASGPIDVCGAGDAFSAGLVSALAAGSGAMEAARLGLVCASIVVERLAATGVASRGAVNERLKDYARRFPDACNP